MSLNVLARPAALVAVVVLSLAGCGAAELSIGHLDDAVTICGGVVCAPIDGCHSASCSGTSCVQIAKPTGSACDDGNPCTSVDVCGAGGQCAGRAYACTPTACQSASVCNGRGGCTVTNQPSGASCDDGNLCTFGDHCNGLGSCQGTLLSCASDACTTRACNGTASCAVNVHVGAACNDNAPCTFGDTCDAGGHCAGTPITCASDACNLRTCNGTSTCAVSIRTGASCSDGDLCTYGDACSNTGACVGTRITCQSDSCTARSCTGSASCLVLPRAPAACDTGLPGVCAAGVIACGNATCTAKVLPSAETCNGLDDDCNGVVDDIAPVACGSSACLVGHTACQAGAPTCVIDPHAADGRPCDDGSRCTSGDVCGNGQCAGLAVNCAQGPNPCTSPVCLPQSGCVQIPNSKVCDDGNLCTGGDQCQNGACVGTTLSCPVDNNPCHAAFCAPQTGCGFTHVADGTVCQLQGLAGACQLGNCQLAFSCHDQLQNGNETGIDCGGGTCPACENGRGCITGPVDCLSRTCVGNVCVSPVLPDVCPPPTPQNACLVENDVPADGNQVWLGGLALDKDFIVLGDMIVSYQVLLPDGLGGFAWSPMYTPGVGDVDPLNPGRRMWAYFATNQHRYYTGEWSGLIPGDGNTVWQEDASLPADYDVTGDYIRAYRYDSGAGLSPNYTPFVDDLDPAVYGGGSRRYWGHFTTDSHAYVRCIETHTSCKPRAGCGTC